MLVMCCTTGNTSVMGYTTDTLYTPTTTIITPCRLVPCDDAAEVGRLVVGAATTCVTVGGDV